MPIADRFVHDLAIVTPTTLGTVDDYGQPVEGTPVTTLVSGNVQPKPRGRGTEVEAVSQGGPIVADHIVFLPLTAPVEGSSYIRFEPDDGDRYEVENVRKFAFGTVSDHLEVDCRRIVSAELDTVAS